MNVHSNGGVLKVTHKAMVKGYDYEVWFCEKAMTNLISWTYMIKQYPDTHYGKYKVTFVVP